MPGLPQGSALSHVLFNVYMHGIVSNQLEVPRRTVSFADDMLVYRHRKNRQEIADLVQHELDRIEEWCTEMSGKIHPDKATTQWCSLNNHAVNANMPEVSIDRKAIKREQTIGYLGIILIDFCQKKIISQGQKRDPEKV